MIDFVPHPLLRSPHTQTVLSSRLALGAISDSALVRPVTIECRDGIRLVALVDDEGVAPAAATNVALDQSHGRRRVEVSSADGEIKLSGVREPKPLVIILHGWLGRADSPYILRAAEHLRAGGFRVARLLLRDHGDTAELNQEMFNSARISEVVEAANWLIERFDGGAGAAVMGFSLGGNFALRVALNEARHSRLRACIAVCPAVDPRASVDAIDSGWFGYRLYFLRRWRRALLEKQAAFPDVYDLEEALRLGSVGALTEYVVDKHLPFADAGEYYARYDLTGDVLAGLAVPTRILAAADDPVIPATGFGRIAQSNSLRIDISRHGGHCAFIQDFKGRSLVGPYAVRYLRDAFRL